MNETKEEHTVVEEAQAQAFDELFTKATAYFESDLRLLHSYGIEPDPKMGIHHSKGLNNYFDLNDGQIYMALPSLRGGVGQLYLLFLKSSLGTDSNHEILEVIDLILPRIVAHELGHSLRHRYGQFRQDNLWLEEQAANQLAMAVVKRNMSPERKERIRTVLAKVVAKLGEKIESKEIGIASYRDIAQALNVTRQIGNSTLSGIELVRGLFPLSGEELLRASGQLPEEVMQGLDQRQEVIQALNEQYTKNAARYAYSQFSWMYYDFLSPQSDYIDEFAVTKLGLKYKLLHEIDETRSVDRIEIQALYRAYAALHKQSEMGSRYFFKRYRTSLLNRIEESALNVPGGHASNDLSELMEIWDQDKADPLELLEFICPPDIQRLFPKHLSQNDETIALPPGKLLPTETDQRFWKYFAQGETDEEVENTVERLRILETIPMLRPLSAELQLNLVHHMYILKLDSGEPVLWKGERNGDIFVLTDGLLEIFLVDERDHSTKIIGRITPGSLFGEYSFITNEEATANIRALRPSKCFVFKGDDLKPMAYRHPAMLVQFAASLAEKLKSANQQVSVQQKDLTIIASRPVGLTESSKPRNQAK